MICPNCGLDGQHGLRIIGGELDGQTVYACRVIRPGDPDWADPEAPDFNSKRAAGALYQLKPDVAKNNGSATD